MLSKKVLLCMFAVCLIVGSAFVYVKSTENKKDKLVVEGIIVKKYYVPKSYITYVYIEKDGNETVIPCWTTWKLVSEVPKWRYYRFYFEKEKGEKLWRLVDWERLSNVE